jgi:hypothetical protein
MSPELKRIIRNRRSYYNAIKRALSFNKDVFPRLVLISFPKSGTHLIEKVLLELGFVKKFFISYETGETTDEIIDDPILVGIGSPRKRSYSEMRDLFSRIGPKEFTIGHLPYSTGAHELLDELNIKKILMLRDPRDAVVSQLFWINNPVHPFYPYISRMKSEEERLMFCIKGIPTEKTETGEAVFIDMRERIKLIMPWIDDPDCLVVRFEELIGPRGSGTLEDQKDTIRKICTHVYSSITETEIDRVAARVFDASSFTFRKGQIGGWENHFTPSHRDEFKRLAGSLLIDLGYEKDLDW